MLQLGHKKKLLNNIEYQNQLNLFFYSNSKSVDVYNSAYWSSLQKSK